MSDRVEGRDRREDVYRTCDDCGRMHVLHLVDGEYLCPNCLDEDDLKETQ